MAIMDAPRRLLTLNPVIYPENTHGFIA